MNIESERKFLLKPGYETEALGMMIEQVYLLSDDTQMLRIRKSGSALTPLCEMTYKRKLDSVSCIEIDKEIDEDQYDLMAEGQPRVIRKIRRSISLKNGLEWITDEFLTGPKKGQILVEVEAYEEDIDINSIELLDLCGEEVTDDPSWRNVNMI